MDIIGPMKIFNFARAGHGLVALALASGAPLAVADPVTWVAGDGAWENAANWSGAALPGATDFVTINHLGAVSSSANNNVALEMVNRSALGITAGKLAMGGTLDTFGAVTLGAAAKLDAGRVIIAGSGALNIGGDNSAVTITQGLFNHGHWHMTGGVNSTLSAESFDNFDGVDIEGGANASANSMINQARVSITGAGSTLAVHGSVTNDGTVFLLAGGQLASHSINNNGALEVTSAALVSDSILNRGLGSRLQVHGAGANLTVSTTLTNADTDGNSALEISAGGNAQIASLINTASVLVDHGQLGGQDLDNQRGVVDVNHATVEITGRLINSARLNIDGSASVHTGSFQQTAGLTHIAGGTLGASDDFGVQVAGGEIRGHGTIDGRLVLSANGLLAAGDSADNSGRFDVAGALDLLGGHFAVDLGGSAATDYDRIAVHGAATLGGSLEVALLDDFNPLLGDVFDIILADSINGVFGNIALPTLGDGLKFITVNGGTFFRLQVAAVPLPAPILLLGGAVALLGYHTRRRVTRGA